MRALRVNVCVAALLVATGAHAVPPLDLNNASPDEIRTLGLPDDVTDALLERLTYQGAFESFYDLRLVPGLTQPMLLRLRERVAILPEQGRGLDVQRLDRLYTSIANLTSQEGANEALIDNYIDQLRVPITLATASTDRLQSLPGVSPIDAAAIVRHVRGGENIKSARDLRSTPGLSYYGWRSVRDYVRYQDEIGRGFSGDAQVRITRPLTITDSEELYREDLYAADNDSTYYNQQFVRDAYSLLGRDEQHPEVTTKIRGRVGETWEAGPITHRRAFESDLNGTLKGYLGTRHRALGPFTLEHFVAGNYSLAMGRGLILENTDTLIESELGLTAVSVAQSYMDEALAKRFDEGFSTRVGRCEPAGGRVGCQTSLAINCPCTTELHRLVTQIQQDMPASPPAPGPPHPRIPSVRRSLSTLLSLEPRPGGGARTENDQE